MLRLRILKTMRSIKQTPKDMRPREKLITKGPAALSDHELIMAIIGSGNVEADVTKIAKDILKILKEKHCLTMEVLYHVKGLGPAKISELLASFELAGRYLLDSSRPIIDTPDAAVEQLSDIRDKKQEYFVCLTLDGANRLIAKRVITIGTLTSSLVHPREVFADAITDRAASIIVAHNHPSGMTRPSNADADMTERLRDAADILGIRFTDHIIVTRESFRSVS